MHKILLTLLSTMLMVLPISCYPKANAADVSGCTGSAVQKVSPWGKTVGVQTIPGHPMSTTAYFRLGATSRYWYCPNGSKPSKIKVTLYGLCATKYDNRDPLSLQGFKYNPYYASFDGNEAVNPPQDMLSWHGIGDEGDSSCTTHGIPNDEERWIHMHERPFWTLSGWIAYNDFPDNDITFKAGGDNKRMFDPAQDPNLNPFG